MICQCASYDGDLLFRRCCRRYVIVVNVGPADPATEQFMHGGLVQIKNQTSGARVVSKGSNEDFEWRFGKLRASSIDIAGCGGLISTFDGELDRETFEREMAEYRKEVSELLSAQNVLLEQLLKKES
eukprot:scaffold11856_cov96-Skeletonema_dohrnii-CCMP3373.AAC.2